MDEKEFRHIINIIGYIVCIAAIPAVTFIFGVAARFWWIGRKKKNDYAISQNEQDIDMDYCVIQED